jgi:hypothetical protein
MRSLHSFNPLDLTPPHGNLAISHNSESHAISLDRDNLDFDAIVDDDSFANVTAEYKHL